MPPNSPTGFVRSTGGVSTLRAIVRRRGAFRDARGLPRIDDEEACSAFRDAIVPLIVACGAGRAIRTGSGSLRPNRPGHHDAGQQRDDTQNPHHRPLGATAPRTGVHHARREPWPDGTGFTAYDATPFVSLISILVGTSYGLLASFCAAWRSSHS